MTASEMAMSAVVEPEPATNAASMATRRVLIGCNPASPNKTQTRLRKKMMTTLMVSNALRRQQARLRNLERLGKQPSY
jgi:hypothetical protein